jgi:hypothetical protein
MRVLILKLFNPSIVFFAFIVLCAFGFVGISNAASCTSVTGGASLTINSDCSDLVLNGAGDVVIHSGTTLNNLNFDTANSAYISIGVSGSNTSITNNGTIFANGHNDGNASEALWVFAGMTLQTFTNNGSISVDAGFSLALDVSGTIGTINNNVGASINSTQGTQTIYVETGGRVNVINNWGTLVGGTEGIYISPNASVGVINNYGSITSNPLLNFGGQASLGNDGTITTLNNLQGSSGAVTIYGKLPVNYNIIIYSSSNYGKLLGIVPIDPSTSTVFGISPLSAGSSIVSNTPYSTVLSGITNTQLGITGTSLTATSNGYHFTLSEASDYSTYFNWDLLVDSYIAPYLGPTAADTQASLHSLAPKLRSAFSGQVMATNFANMNTYDCDLFDAKGICVSVGGQQTYVDNPNSNMTSTVVVAGYKVSPQIRIGGFLNQNINNNTVSGVQISNANPLMGLFAVWNQNEDHLGYQVKIANAYQDKDVTTTRDVVGTSEAGTGKTNLNTQSYVGELSYAFLANEEKTIVRPYAAIRYTRIKQDGYTEQTSAEVTVPLTYSAIEDRSTTALVGIKLNHKLADKINLTGSLGVEQDLDHHVDKLVATGVADLTSENFNDSIKRTRPVASVGAYYMPAKNQAIAASLYYQQLPFQNTGSATAYVNYTIGF